ncbi:AraC family transcriptional regulator, partial [Streptomyces brasiliscabiei]
DPPSPGDRAIFARVFRSKVLFDCEFDGLVIARADLDRPNPRADAELAAHARKLLSAVMDPVARSTVADVDQLVRLLLPAGRASIQTCAMSLGVPVR